MTDNVVDDAVADGGGDGGVAHGALGRVVEAVGEAARAEVVGAGGGCGAVADEVEADGTRHKLLKLGHVHVPQFGNALKLE
jgi:hypothetical protein